MHEREHTHTPHRRVLIQADCLKKMANLVLFLLALRMAAFCAVIV